jgi:hypothetical protein
MCVNRVILTLILLATVAQGNLPAVESFPAQGEMAARKFDEFDLTEVHYEDMQARLDHFVIDVL